MGRVRERIARLPQPRGDWKVITTSGNLPLEIMPIEELVEQAKHLLPQDRGRLIDEREDSLATQPEAPEETPVRRSRGLAMFIAMAGTAHSAFTDVSMNKGKHLAEIYAGKR